MPDSPSASEKEEARRAVTTGLTDGTTTRTLQDAGDSSKRKREEIKAARERRERERKEAVNKKCLLSPVSHSFEPAAN
jgi:UDP-N-acetylmuramoylalanine-D-glutamate ligase